MKSLKNFKPVNPEGVKGTILSACDLPGDAWCGCIGKLDDPGHHCNDCSDCTDSCTDCVDPGSCVTSDPIYV